MTINQWVPAAHRGDAVGDSARRVRDLLRARGFDSNLYALSIDDSLRDDVLPFDHISSHIADVTILHFAIPSIMSTKFRQLKGRTIIQYHNITPAHFFAPYDSGIFRIAALGRKELKTLVGHVDVALGDSEYNRRELETLGFENTGVMPIIVDTKRITDSPAEPVLEETLSGDGLTNILFVGRIAPNKKIEDIIKLAEHYKRYVDTDYRFIFVGRTDAVPRYYKTILALIAEYQMPKDRFIFTGTVTDSELATYYHASHAYISLSEHEGFCVPLVEAMSANLPILAFGSTAVPETLGGAGICFSPKDLEYAAEMLGLLVYDDRVRSQVIVSQQSRVADFGPARTDAVIDDLISVCSHQ
tara:strand:+ start:9059 stop:10132 length:1074 start_codon:yes stop_codon:yes gene_type:complete